MTEKKQTRTTLHAAKTEPTPDKSTTTAPAKKGEIPLNIRLAETTTAMMNSYDSWSKKKSTEQTEKLQEDMHELRRALAAVEISIAMSDKDK